MARTTASLWPLVGALGFQPVAKELGQEAIGQPGNVEGATESLPVRMFNSSLQIAKERKLGF